MDYFNLIKNNKLIVINYRVSLGDDGIIHDELRLGFLESYRLTVHAQFQLSDAKGIRDFIGDTLKNIEYNRHNVTLEFSDNKKIILLMEEDEWRYREVMTLGYGELHTMW